MKYLRKKIYLSGLLVISCQAFAQTKAILDPEEEFISGKNTIWSPLFQASWDQLNAFHQGAPERVEPPNALIDKLNSYDWNEDSVFPENSHQIFAGPATRDFYSKTAKVIKEKYQIDLPPVQNYDPTHNLVYGALARNVEFKTPFFRSKKKPLSFTTSTGKTHSSAFFGTAGKASANFGENVRVLNHEDHGKAFILSISTMQEEEFLIVYQDPETKSFQQAIQNIRGFQQTRGASYLHKGDVVKIPYLRLNSHTDFSSQLQGSRYYQGEPTPCRIVSAFQITEFELFEKGAQVRIATGTHDAPFGPLPPKPKPRHFICDLPFVVFLWREGAELPYFATRIDNTEALTPFEEK